MRSENENSNQIEVVKDNKITPFYIIEKSMKKRFILALIAIILLLVGNIAFIIMRSSVMSSVFSGMTALQDQRDDVFDALLGINELTALGEHVHNWNDEQMEEYKSLRLETDSVLERLSHVSPLQTIDSMRDNLLRKEYLLQHIMEVTRMKSETEENLTTDREVTVSDKVTTINRRSGNLFQKHKEEVTTTSRQRKIHVETVDEDAYEQMQSHRQNIKELTDSLADINRWLVRNATSLVKTNQGTISTLMREQEDLGKKEGQFSNCLGTSLLILTMCFVVWYFRQDYRKMRELQKKNEQNRQLIDSRRTAVYSIVHELKSPLAAITGLPRLFKTEKDETIIADYADTLEDNTTSMNEMVETLLNYFKVESGKMVLNEVPFRVGCVCESIISIYGQLAEHKGILLEVNVQQNPVLIGDENCLRLVLGNLVSNAVKFTNEGRVSVNVSYKTNHLTLEVRDEGPGITDEDMKRIFEPFAQLSNAAAHNGFGIGLALVDEIVRQMNGTITVDDNGNKGTLFTVRLPMPLADSATALMQKTKVPMLEAAYSVLIIDNDKSLLAIAQQMLQHVGASCDTCTNVGQLMNLIRENYYDVVITDLKMSEMNGYDVLDLLRHSDVGNSKQVPVIVSTLSGLITEKELLSKGFTACLIKPYGPKELVETIEKCVKTSNVFSQPDFSRIPLLGEEDVLLQSLLDETREVAESFQTAFNRKDVLELRALVHHTMPSWTRIHCTKPLRDLYLAFHTGRPIDWKVITKHVNEIEKMCQTISEMAEKRLEELK